MIMILWIPRNSIHKFNLFSPFYFLPFVVLFILLRMLEMLEMLQTFKRAQVKKSETFGGDWTPVGTSTHRTVAAGDELSYTLGSLEPSTFYRVEISAKNELGSSHPTSLVFRTADFADGTGKSSFLLIPYLPAYTCFVIFIPFPFLFSLLFAFDVVALGYR